MQEAITNLTATLADFKITQDLHFEALQSQIQNSDPPAYQEPTIKPPKLHR